MYLRFVISAIDEQSGRRQGLFQAMTELQEEEELNEFESARYDELYDWFLKNLKEPRSFSRSNKYHAKDVALSWFKDTAREHVSRMREIADMLNDHGIEVSLIRTDKPGYIVYEDRHQVVAEPFRETIT